MSTTVLLVDDHELIRQGLRRAFERSGDFEVVGEAARSARRIEAVARHAPQVVILDVRLPDGSGLDAATKMRELQDDIGIVVLTMYAGDEQLFGALEAGASAFVPKDAPSDDVVAAARHAAVSPRSFTANDLAGAMRRRLSPSGPQLSDREKEVLRLLADGLGRRPDLEEALHQRVDDEDPHLQALREARRRQPRAGTDDRAAPRADHPGHRRDRLIKPRASYFRTMLSDRVSDTAELVCSGSLLLSAASEGGRCPVYRRLHQMLAYMRNDPGARRRDDGASAVEYGLLIAAIAAVIVVAVFAFGGFVQESSTTPVTRSTGSTGVAADDVLSSSPGAP